jgi:hypothetical protein
MKILEFFEIVVRMRQWLPLRAIIYRNDKVDKLREGPVPTSVNANSGRRERKMELALVFSKEPRELIYASSQRQNGSINPSDCRRTNDQRERRQVVVL